MTERFIQELIDKIGTATARVSKRPTDESVACLRAR